MMKQAKRAIREFLCKRFHLPGRYQGLPFALWSRLPQGQALTMVDVGAHDGSFTRAIQRFCGLERAVLIEPIPSKAEVLRRQFLPPRHVVLECVAAQEPGTLTLEVNEALATSSVLRIHRAAPELAQIPLGGPRYVEREARTLDEIAATLQLEATDLLKLDVQGFEDRVLRGAAKLLERTMLIWTEVSFVPLYEHSCVFSDLHQLLRGMGFILMDLEGGFRAPDGELLQADALYRRRET